MPQVGSLHARIAEAARQLNEQRERWLHPPESIDPIARAVDAENDFADVPQEARGADPSQCDHGRGCPGTPVNPPI